ncbi:lysosomal Pro-X carboxypeptidase [Thraustotheca clavata]|uniref:Lysosomal Pro-X carboxypeptidase n=1 Tax=Thraustotheca clavata TaxID=74557 RepID=A0A1V9Z5C0_9STRA|nr:lysosomal Pro-X carboxypeptidase [Thraustotheca clavata]
MEDAPLLRPQRQLSQRSFVNWSIFVPVCLGIGLVAVGQLLLSLYHNTFGLDSTLEVPNYMNPKPNVTNCTLHWFEQRVDHFTTLNTTYQQRYYVYDKFWSRKSKGDAFDGPILFYCGNEGDVTLYVNNTGLMWENAQSLGAALIFAEHRYFGKSYPFANDYMNNLQYLTHEQALADYATLIQTFQVDNQVDVPVVAFGGSYGGMLAAWFRMKYPSVIAGSIAASAPILGFPRGYPGHFHGEKYWQVVTHDAKPEAGSAPACEGNVRATWPVLFGFGNSSIGRNKLSEIFQLCTPLNTSAQVEKLAMNLLMGWDTMAMGNFPFPSSYLTDGAVDLPAFPVRAACNELNESFTITNPSAVNDTENIRLLTAMKVAVDVYANATKSLTCSPLDQDYDGIWGYIWCSQMLPQESYFDTDGIHDMFWPRNVSLVKITSDCQKKWGVTPDPQWIRYEYGPLDRMISSTSNIVFTNGGYDPWSSGGVLTNPWNPSIEIVSIPEGAHHLDLFFSHVDDPISVRLALNMAVELNATTLDPLRGEVDTSSGHCRWVRDAIERRLKKAIATGIVDLSGPSSTSLIHGHSCMQLDLLPKELYATASRASWAKKQLHEIYLTNNSLSLLSPEISLFENLVVLGLGGNALTSLPNELGSLLRLEKLYAERNHLSCIPEAISNCTRLTHIFLDSNRFTSFPTALFACSRLQHVGLSHNELRSIPAQIHRLSWLISLDLDGNRIGPSLPHELGFLVRLQRLGLEHNCLDTLPTFVLKLPQLTCLRMNGNRAPGHVVKDSITGEVLDGVNVPTRFDGYLQLREAVVDEEGNKQFVSLNGLVPTDAINLEDSFHDRDKDEVQEENELESLSMH